MDSLKKHGEVVYRVLHEYAQFQYSCKDLERRFIVSDDRRNYLLLTLGWQNDGRVHGCLVHVELAEDKIWIHRDGTEHGIANDLVAAGISKNEIVLAFHPPEVRQYTEYAAS